jgi:oxygen-independent coproporphyrinogen-3 oxidase
MVAAATHAAVEMTATVQPQALYIHIPFCASKCRYCDFASEVAGAGTVRKCLDAIHEELRRRGDMADTLSSVYIGGGTPSLMSGDQITQLLETVTSSFQVSETSEITIETNPGDCTGAIARTWRDLGANRVSVGAQSFDPAVLAFLGRRHTVDDIYRTMTSVRDAGFSNISIDLIYGVPGQNSAGWRETLRKTVDLQPTHVAVYGLTCEPGTPLSADVDAGRVRPIDEETELSMYRTAIETLENAGIHHYEISNFAVPGSESRHNMVYWRNEPYVGIGPGAVSYIDGTRITNHRAIDAYVDAMNKLGTAAAESERISPEMEMAETCIQMLRLTEGIDRTEFRHRFGKEITDVYKEALNTLAETNLIEVTEAKVRHTQKGRELANETAQRFLP